MHEIEPLLYLHACSKCPVHVRRSRKHLMWHISVELQGTPEQSVHLPPRTSPYWDLQPERKEQEVEDQLVMLWKLILWMMLNDLPLCVPLRFPGSSPCRCLFQFPYCSTIYSVPSRAHPHTHPHTRTLAHTHGLTETSLCTNCKVLWLYLSIFFPGVLEHPRLGLSSKN